jgi:transposase
MPPVVSDDCRASRSRKVKTDKRDARALCDACHLGAFRPSHRSSDESRLLRKHLRVRDALVQTRSRMISLCRSLLRQEGIRVPTGDAVTFAKRVRALEFGSDLRDAVEPLLKSQEEVCAQIALVDKKVAEAVKGDERVQRLTTGGDTRDALKTETTTNSAQQKRSETETVGVDCKGRFTESDSNGGPRCLAPDA